MKSNPFYPEQPIQYSFTFMVIVNLSFSKLIISTDDVAKIELDEILKGERLREELRPQIHIKVTCLYTSSLISCLHTHTYWFC